MDPLTVVISGGVGAAAGALVVYMLFGRARRTVSVEGAAPKVSVKSGGGRTVAREEMERARRDLNAIFLEKDLISNALTRVYEAEVDGRISRQEREELASRYKQRLKEVEGNLGDAEVTIEVGELERLREELLNLFEGKIRQIEVRLNAARVKLDRMKGWVEPAATLEEVEAAVEAEKPRVKKTRVKTEEAEVSDKVKALREEVLEALARLEQMDIEG